MHSTCKNDLEIFWLTQFSFKEIVNTFSCFGQIQTSWSENSEPSGGTKEAERCKIENCILHQKSETQLNVLLLENFTKAFVLINAVK